VAVAAIETEITETPVGAPELAGTVARIAVLEGELEGIRAALGPLVPDAASPPSEEEQTVRELERALRNLKTAAEARRDAG